MTPDHDRSRDFSLTPSDAEIELYRGNLVNPVHADGLAYCVASSAAAMVLIMHDKRDLVYNEERIQPPVPSKWWELIGNAYIHILHLHIS